jgi:Zn ribbon nucleic-acid-binding protein
MKCPGQDTQYWDKNAVFETECPECGHTLEFFKDDTTRLCKNCQKKIVNPKMDFGCASYCNFAEQCLGSLPEDFKGVRDDLLKDRVAVEVKRYLKTDFKRIGHAVRMAGFAEKIGKKEKANLPVVLCAAYFYNIVTNVVLEKYGSDLQEYPEKENSGIIRKIMEKLGAREEMIQEIIHIVNSGSSLKKEDSPEKNIIHDAHILAIIDACNKEDSKEKDLICAELEQQIRTSVGKELTKQLKVQKG